MFGYVFPCKMELKIKDYEKFKSYYCGLCLSLKNNFGNLPRLSLNYDMTFLSILLDDYNDDNSLQSKLLSFILKKYLKNQHDFNELKKYIEKEL